MKVSIGTLKVKYHTFGAPVRHNHVVITRVDDPRDVVCATVCGQLCHEIHGSANVSLVNFSPLVETEI